MCFSRQRHRIVCRENCLASDRLDLEVKRNETENQCLQILHKVVEDTETFRIRGLRDVVDGADLSRLLRVND